MKVNFEAIARAFALVTLNLVLFLTAALHAQVATVNVTTGTLGRQIPVNFTGYSIELEQNGFLGNPTSPNTVFYQYMKNLGTGVLRMGGNSTDRWCWTGAPSTALCTAGTLTGTEIGNYFYAASQTNWKVILGNNLGQNAPTWSLGEVVNGIAPNSSPSQVLGLEIGNEPDLYTNDGLRVAANYPGSTYTQTNHATEFKAYATAYKGNTTAAVYPLAGASPCCFWQNQSSIGTFIDTVGASNLGFATVHDYPLSVCGSTITAANLLASGISATLAAAGPPWVTAATSRGLSLRISETNSASCGGQNGVSNRFASTLWALDWLFTGAKAGFSGMNFHNGGLPGGNYAFVQTTVSQVGSNFTYANAVKPMYYGLYMFAREAQTQYFLPAAMTTSSNIAAWSTTACSTCAVKVYVINKDASASGTVNVNLNATMGTASLLLLSAPAISSDETLTTYGGAQFNNATGFLGTTQVSSVLPSGNQYSFSIPNSAIAQLTINNVAPDAYVQDGGSSTTNFGTASSLVVKTIAGTNTGFDRKSYLKFDITGVSKVGSISSAKMRLYGQSQLTSGTTPVTVYTIPDDTWTETGINWNNQPARGTSLGTTDVGTAAQYWEWDLTSWVQSQVAAGASHANVVIEMDTPTTTNGAVFNSREAGSNPPVLLINP